MKSPAVLLLFAFLSPLQAETITFSGQFYPAVAYDVYHAGIVTVTGSGKVLITNGIGVSNDPPNYPDADLNGGEWLDMRFSSLVDHLVLGIWGLFDGFTVTIYGRFGDELLSTPVPENGMFRYDISGLLPEPSLISRITITAIYPPFNQGGVRWMSFDIVNPPPLPKITSLQPPKRFAGGPAFDLAIQGANFTDAMQVKWDGQLLPILATTPTEIRVFVEPTLYDQPERAQVTVVSPDYTTPAWSYTIDSRPAEPPLSPIGSFTHLATEGGWSSEITLINTGSDPADVSLEFFDDDGRDLSLPLADVSGTPSDSSSTHNYQQRIEPKGSRFLRSSGDAGDVVTGSSWLETNGAVGGMTIFRWDFSGQEAAVPLDTHPEGPQVLVFDNTNGLVTGVALDNRVASKVYVTATVRNASGNQVDTAELFLPARGHLSFLLADQIPATKDLIGTVEFTVPGEGDLISVLGLRFLPSGVFTNIPILWTNPVNLGVVPHVAAGGEWETTLTLLNPTDEPVSTQILLLNDAGERLAVSVDFPLGGPGGTSLSRSLPPHSIQLVHLSGPASGDVQTGSIQVSSASSISGFVSFHWRFNGQEATVPMDTFRNHSLTMAFNNANGLVSGISITSLSSDPVEVSVIAREPSGDEIGRFSIDLAAKGHESFVLTSRFPDAANKKGTLELIPSDGGSIDALGIRAAPSGALTMIPVVMR